jgi:hypothetical protein
MKNYAHDVRPPKNNNPYDEWELKVLRAADGKGITKDILALLFDRTEGSVSKKAGQVGSSLRAKKK